MSFPPYIWNQIKNKTSQDFIRALRKQYGEPDEINGAEHLWRISRTEHISIHYHGKKGYGPKLIKNLIRQAGWTIENMKELKFIK